MPSGKSSLFDIRSTCIYFDITHTHMCVYEEKNCRLLNGFIQLDKITSKKWMTKKKFVSKSSYQQTYRSFHWSGISEIKQSVGWLQIYAHSDNKSNWWSCLNWYCMHYQHLVTYTQSSIVCCCREGCVGWVSGVKVTTKRSIFSILSPAHQHCHHYNTVDIK